MAECVLRLRVPRVRIFLIRAMILALKPFAKTGLIGDGFEASFAPWATAFVCRGLRVVK